MRHTFLFEEGLWLARGSYFDEKNNEIGTEGETRISHSNVWVNEGTMRLLIGDSPIEFKNRYEYYPPSEGKDFSNWESFNPAIGKMFGRFMVVDDCIISTYTTEYEEYSGSECLIKIDDNTYLNRGFAFKGDEKLSSWAVTLKRAGQK